MPLPPLRQVIVPFACAGAPVPPCLPEATTEFVQESVVSKLAEVGLVHKSI
ncbi:hypothetical protein FC12_GL001993 [Lacticaseibacillus paracasei subsp. tolerans DSM 20258]|nr:hypothetical protein FC12_GL001993 [Lacticaseibacillus paracasei subsp. tolerans DSM 20258]